MKIVILGAKGMLGSDLGRVFYDFRPYLLDMGDLDVTKEKVVWDLLHNLKPDIIINAAASSDVDGCETKKDFAMEINGKAPGNLAKTAKDIGAIFVHYSTDYVFPGDKKEGYDEEDKPGPAVNFYGESKLAGENAIREVDGNYYLIRTSWLFGIGRRKQGDIFSPIAPYVKVGSSKGKIVNEEDGEIAVKNFVETIIKISKEKEEILVVDDQHGKPTYTLDLARKTRELIEEKYDFGTYHITNEPEATWYEFAREIAADLESEITKNTVDPSEHRLQKLAKIVPCTSEEFIRPAKRPKYSILLNTKLPPMRNWNEALREYLLSRGK